MDYVDDMLETVRADAKRENRMAWAWAAVTIAIGSEISLSAEYGWTWFASLGVVLLTWSAGTFGATVQRRNIACTVLRSIDQGDLSVRDCD